LTVTAENGWANFPERTAAYTSAANASVLRSRTLNAGCSFWPALSVSSPIATRVVLMAIHRSCAGRALVNPPYCHAETLPRITGASDGLDDHYVALAFMRSDGGDIVACEPKEARSSGQAIRMADSLATTEGHCGAIALSNTGGQGCGDRRGTCRPPCRHRRGGGMHPTRLIGRLGSAFRSIPCEFHRRRKESRPEFDPNGSRSLLGALPNGCRVLSHMP